MTKDIIRFNNDIRMVCGVFGQRNITWTKDASCIRIAQFPLPNNFRQRYTNLLVLVPENYGYGGCFRDIFLAPDLDLLTRDRKNYRRLDTDIHGFRRYPYSAITDEIKEVFIKNNWFYLCLHDKDPKSSILNYLYKVNLFLSNPYKNWAAIENGYDV